MKAKPGRAAEGTVISMCFGTVSHFQGDSRLAPDTTWPLREQSGGFSLQTSTDTSGEELGGGG